eukprot:TRINITY_DN5239_c0_g1_i1.p1 TRINITY_DN5239_c0_g1~~TRINITY_DN5239_c0_g1_i1.p1  ORF type:complete len:402 (-),score=88.10 TRINITY_DN5239_c0_g1_i1:12-1217(-)
MDNFCYLSESFLGCDVLEKIVERSIEGFKETNSLAFPDHLESLKTYQSLQLTNKELNRISWKALPIQINYNWSVRMFAQMWKRKVKEGMNRNDADFKLFQSILFKMVQHPKYTVRVHQVLDAISLNLMKVIEFLAPKLEGGHLIKPFIEAIHSGSLEVIQYLASESSVLNEIRNYYEVWAAAIFCKAHNADEIVKFLIHNKNPKLSKSADEYSAFITFQPLNVKNPKVLIAVSEKFPINWVYSYRIAVNDQLPEVAPCCRERMTPEEIQTKCSSILSDAIRLKDEDNAIWMLEKGVKPSTSSANAIANASSSGALGILKVLVEKISPQPEDKRFILNQTVQARQLECVKFLLERDKSWDPSEGDNMALEIAHRNGFTEIVEYLQKDKRVKKLARQKGCVVS